MKKNKIKINQSLLKVEPMEKEFRNFSIEERPSPAIKIVVILGQTAVGKSDLAVKIARKFNGEIISADSRQVYKGLDIGSGKITRKEMGNVPHYLLDIANPKRQFSVAQYKKLADKKILEISKRDKLPIIVGGTGFYIQAIVDGLVLPEVKPNYTLRKELEKMSATELFEILKKLDKSRASEIEKDNPRRLIRAIEIAKALGKVPKLKTNSKYDVLQIGLKLSDEELKEKIHKRLLARMKKGMVREVERLHSQGVSWEKLESLGLEYRSLAQYLQRKKDTSSRLVSLELKKEMLSKIETESWHFAKRQMRWFKRDSRIKWFKPSEVEKIEKEVKEFVR